MKPIHNSHLQPSERQLTYEAWAVANLIHTCQLCGSAVSIDSRWSDGTLMKCRENGWGPHLIQTPATELQHIGNLAKSFIAKYPDSPLCAVAFRIQSLCGDVERSVLVSTQNHSTEELRD